MGGGAWGVGVLGFYGLGWLVGLAAKELNLSYRDRNTHIL